MLVVFVLSACSRERDSLGNFDNARMAVLAGCDMPRDSTRGHSEMLTSKGLPTFECTFRPRAGTVEDSLQDGALDPPLCFCRGSLVLHRANNRTDASLLQVQVEHCRHELAVDGVMDAGISALLTETQRAQLKRDLEEPARGARRTASADIGMVSAVRIYGDRVVEINWWRDAYRQPDGLIEVQPTESLLVALRARRSGDVEQVTVSNEPRVTTVRTGGGSEGRRRSECPSQ